ncbi:TonB-dependent receptor [Phenylobacterium sp. J426]|uniref:TonB-dependent receptor n=1 Tax=Phenylobacterium sp. J426 TaxID=2898439 RepID=UPI0027E36ABF|nr:TonB-dependent receptor [Phenylobacterium sp. J426]
MTYLRSASALALVAGLAAAPASAQEAASAMDASVDEVIVTAQKRSERAQDVPISMAVLGASALEKANVTNVQDLQRVAPSFYVSRASQAANTRISIRGIGSAGNAAIEPSVGAFVDGVYIARPGPLLAGLNDVASVEILRGPQGTLFGRNASMGALSIRTAEPTAAFGGEAMAEVGNFGRRRATGVVNLPVSERIQARLAVLYDGFDGYGRSALNGERFGQLETTSLRGAVRAELSDSVTWLLRGDYQRQDGDGLVVASVDAATVTPQGAANIASRLNGLHPELYDTFGRRVRQLTDGNMDDEQYGLASELSWEIGDYELRLISGLRRWDNIQGEDDVAYTAAGLFGRDAGYQSKTHSEELQLISPETLLDGRLRYVAGLYYFKEDYRISSDVNLGSGYCDILIRNALPARLTACLAGPQRGASTSLFTQTTESYAVYGQSTYSVTDVWDVTLGLRWSRDEKDGYIRARALNSAAGIIVANDEADLAFSGDKVTYRLNTTWRPTRGTMVFATVSTGYKSGGFDSGTGNVLGTARVFAPEETTNYELGVKSDLLDGRLTANATAFVTEIDGFQLRSYNGTFFSVRNAGSIRQRGVEFEFVGRPTDDLTLSLSGTRLDSEYTDFRNAPGLPGFGGIQDLTGARAAFSPKWQGVVSADYERPLPWGV